MKIAILLFFLALPVAAQDLRGVEVLRDLEYGKGGGTSLKLDLYRPEVSTMQPKPVVLSIRSTPAQPIIAGFNSHAGLPDESYNRQPPAGAG